MAKTITFALSDELHKEFSDYCYDKQVTQKDALVLAIELILKKKKQKV